MRSRLTGELVLRLEALRVQHEAGAGEGRPLMESFLHVECSAQALDVPRDDGALIDARVQGADACRVTRTPQLHWEGRPVGSPAALGRL
jgi:hypothetical protein